MSIKGVDVSHHQGAIDWRKVRGNGVDFSFIKASESVGFVDPRYKENVKNAREAGVLVGSYHFARGGDPIKEADFFLSTVGEIQQWELLALDWEIEHASPAAWCRAFLDRVESKVGFKPLLYTNEARVKSINWAKVVTGDFGLWVAKYPWLDVGVAGSKPTSGQWAFWVLWQFSSKGKVGGITGNVDLNKNDSIFIDTLKEYGKPTPSCNHRCPLHCRV